MGGTLHLRKGGLRRGIFQRLPSAVRVLSEQRDAEGGVGQQVGVEQLAAVFLRLQGEGANNINLVTPTHFVPQIAAALRLAKRDGLRIPVVYNTGSYERVETLRLLDGLVDIYLPDLKYGSPEPAERYSHAPDYFETASAAIAEMVRQVPEAVFEEREDGTVLMKRGVIVRHLMLPGAGDGFPEGSALSS